MLTRLPTGLWAFLFIALLTVLLAGPFWQIPGLPAGTDDAQTHAGRSVAMYRAFEQGVYWPRWVPDAYNGLGAPIFHHYSPGLYWLAAAALGAGIGLDQALKLIVTAALLLSGLGVYGWLRHAFSPEAGLAGAALYLLHLHILTRSFYYVGDHPRLLALLLLPVCLWAFTALHMQSRVRYWLAAVASLVALVFSHNLTAVVGAGVLALYWLLLAAGYRRPDGLLRCALAALLAALLSAGFWLPALADLSLVQIDNGTKGHFYFGNHFLNWWQLFRFQSPVQDSHAGNTLLPLTSLGFGAASWLALAAGLASSLFAAGRERRGWGLAGVLFALAMLTLTLRVSEPLWETVPGFSFLQFPFRFLSIAPLGVLPAAALAVDVWPTSRRWLPGLTLLMGSILVLFPYLFPAHTSRGPFTPVQTWDAADIRLHEQTSRVWGMTGSNEFLVRGAYMRVIVGQTAQANATRLTWRSPHEAVADLSGQTEPILLRLHFHPGWSAGERAEMSPGPAGWVQVTKLRNPDQPLVVRWEGTGWQRWGERLSLIGLLATIAGLLFLAFRRRQEVERIEPPSRSSLLTSRSSRLTLSAMVGCVLVMVAAFNVIDRSSGGPFLRHSPPGQLAFTVEGQPVTLGDASSPQVTLLGWELLSGTTPKPGGRIRVRLYWQGHGPINEDLYGFLHLYTPSLQRSWAVDNRDSIPRPGTQWWNPDKYYIDDLRLSLPVDLPPVSYSLVAGMVSSSGARLTVPGSPDNLVHLRELSITPVRPGFFQKERPTTVAQADTADGLRLQGYDLLSAADAPTLRLFWETGDGVANDWITYIHLHSPQGERIAQFDGPALAGLQPTGQWEADALYIDRRQLVLPTGLAPGTYLFRIGLYSFASAERLPLRPDGDVQGHFEDGQLLIPITIPADS